MTPPLPLPVRVAAGLVVTAVEQVRDLELPRRALELPVTAVSQALQASMRLQQKLTELAIKGDRVLGVGPPIEDEPAWATFDEDLPPAPNATRRNGHGAAPPRATAPDPFDEPGPVDPGSVDPTPIVAAPIVPAPTVTGPVRTAPVDRDDATPLADDDTPAAPDILPGYANLTLPQLRGKLRHLGLDELRALLAWEQAHGDRPPFVTMLSNRIATVSEA